MGVEANLPTLHPGAHTARRLTFAAALDSFADPGRTLNIVEQSIAALPVPRHALAAAYAVLGRLDDDTLPLLSLYRNGAGDVTFEVLRATNDLYASATIRRTRRIEYRTLLPAHPGAKAGRTPPDRRNRLSDRDGWQSPPDEVFRDTWSLSAVAGALDAAARPNGKTSDGPGGSRGPKSRADRAPGV